MSVLRILAFILITGRAITAEEVLKTDKEVLLDLKLFHQASNPVNQGPYGQWNGTNKSPCGWQGIACDSLGRVTGVYLNDSTIAGKIFPSFSQLTRLTHLDLSNNTIEGPLPAELNKCVDLRYLNLSHNIISGEMHLTGLTRLETLDLTLNRFEGEIRANFPALCTNLVALNISTNNFTGEITGCFDACPKLKFVDLSSNRFSGEIWRGFEQLQEFSVADNYLQGIINPETFSSRCSLRVLDLSANGLQGSFPNSISNCSSLAVLNLWGNFFGGGIPSGIGSLSNLTTLFLGNNSFDSEIPEQLLNCPKLVFIELSRNNFSGDIQPIFGKFTTLKFLLLHSNAYAGGVESSGILSLPNLERLDLSFNKLSGKLPVEVSRMPKLKFLILAHNHFYGKIPPEYGSMSSLQALDLSFNNLSGGIPSAIGNLTSLLWLMLANNRLTGEIPTEIGNCRSLLWLNLANNSLSGSVPASISEIGTDPEPTFEANRRDGVSVPPVSGECQAMKRWIPASYPPFSFVYTLMTRKTCRTTWDRLLKGYGVFPICFNSSSSIQTLTISGYLQLSSNGFSGQIPPEIRRMKRLSLIHIDGNRFSGGLPPEIGDLPLVVLNASNNRFFGEIPPEIGRIKCLESLDLSFNNFSGDFMAGLNQLSDLNSFNISYNPLLSGHIPISGQMSTFGEDSFAGDPLVVFFGGKSPPAKDVAGGRRNVPWTVAFWILLAIAVAFFVCAGVSFVRCLSGRVPVDQDPDGPFLDGGKRKSDVESSSPSTSDNAVKVFRLDKTVFTHLDIVTATRNFSDDMVIGRGGYGVVYQGVLPDGRHVAVKKLERMGWEGEREFRAEMEALTGQSGSKWPHPNLVVLYGWCLFGSEKLLVYDYMEGGSLDEVITDWARFLWERRLEVAVGVARALVFLHHECKPAIVHRDVKASNVLLDRRGRARVTDFGLSRIVGDGESHVSTMVAGTVGYVAPEYGYTCKATTNGDVYSFGVLAMELATGRRAVDGGEECLVEWVRRVGAREVIGSITVKETKKTIQMWGLMKIAMWCTAEAPHMRPDMREVLAMLLSICPCYDNCSSNCSGSRSSDDDHSSVS